MIAREIGLLYAGAGEEVGRVLVTAAEFVLLEENFDGPVSAPLLN